MSFVSSLSPLGNTAVAVAGCRARESVRPDAWFYDPLAIHVAGSGVPPVSDGLATWVIARTRFLDELVVTSVANGVRQLVIVGAGLDARAFRLPLPAGVAVYELDHGEVFALKETMLAEAGLVAPCARRTVVADLVNDDWRRSLADAGWNAAQPTVWIAEGLLVYLTPDDRGRLLKQLAAASASGSVLGATLSTRTQENDNSLWHPAAGPDIAGWLDACGWRADLITLAEANEGFGRPISPALAEVSKGRLVHAVPVEQAG